MDNRTKKYSVRLAIILAVVFIVLNFSFSYFSVLDSCYIRIKDPGLASSKGIIKDAIRYLRDSDSEAYKTFCKHTDHIIETDCMGSDWHLNEKVRGQDAAGCYIKGSKTLYLNPLKLKTLETENVSELLKKYSAASKEFWTRVD